MKIVFLHLSDIHIEKESDISDLHLTKIVDSLKSYKNFQIKHIILIISGDLTHSGTKEQFSNVWKLVGTIIQKSKDAFDCTTHLLVVPGNHDVFHNGKFLTVENLKRDGPTSLQATEYQKLDFFYEFSKPNKCFENKEMYADKKTFAIDGFNIQANLINNAIFSTYDQNAEYKSLLYIPNDIMDSFTGTRNDDFVVTVMHHSPDFYKDDIKINFEKKIVSNSHVLFCGHEHNNEHRQTSYAGDSSVTIQFGGCLCVNGNWDASSYRIGILDIERNEYMHQKFDWNTSSKQYEHDTMSKSMTTRSATSLSISDDFLCQLYDDDFRKNYYVFPRILLQEGNPEKAKTFESLDTFVTKLLSYEQVIIKGASSVGKSILLKKLFEKLHKHYTVLFLSPSMILSKSKKRWQNIEKLLRHTFEDIYGDSESTWQSFEQCEKAKCILIFDDFDQIKEIEINDVISQLSNRFGTIILSSSQTVEFDPISLLREDKTKIAKFEINPLVGRKRRELLERVVRKKTDDKSDLSICNIVNQIDLSIKCNINIIPPEPYYLIQIAENYINNVGEAVNTNSAVFSKVFEANITSKIDTVMKEIGGNLTVDLMYVLLGKIAYYIHFHKSYPIERTTINGLIQEYANEYGKKVITDDVLNLAKRSKILISNQDNCELYRFENKSQLAYFAAKEIISKYRDKKDNSDILNITNNCCFNICTDILLFIIFQTDDISILRSIINFIETTIKKEENWVELDIPHQIPEFWENNSSCNHGKEKVEIKEEKAEIEQTEESAEEIIIQYFKIQDIYDWDDSVVDKFNNKLIRMTSLLHIISKSLPCFEHRLKKDDKMLLIEYLYKLPNIIFMCWARFVDAHYSDIIDALKLFPYQSSKKHKTPRKIHQKEEQDARDKLFFSSVQLLLNLYYIPAINAAGRHTYEYLNRQEFFDFSKKQTHKLENLMMLEQMQNNDSFVTQALQLSCDLDDDISALLLRYIVRHGIVTRNDKRENIARLEQKFFNTSAKKPLLIERGKNRYLKK